MKLRDYLFPPVIINPLPVTLTNGTIADATQVMTNFNWIVSQVNANTPTGTTGSYVFVPLALVGGTANAITLTPVPAASGYSDGLSYRFVAASGNTGSVTINVSGLGAKNLAFTSGNSLFGGELVTGIAYDICFSASLNAFILLGTASNVGNFTPTLQFGGGNTGLTTSTNTGRYFKLNDLWLCAIAIVLTAKGSSTGVATIALPFSINPGFGGAGLIPFGTVQAANLTYTGQIAPAPVPGASTFKIQQSASAGTPSFLDNTAFANNTAIYATFAMPTVF